MGLPGPLPVSSPSPVQAQEPQFRLHQRITAEVMHVEGTRAVLAVGGYPIVARLESPDHGAELAGRRIAHFEVTALSEGEIVLKPAETKPAPAGPTGQTAVNDIAAGLLEQLGVELSDENILLARAALSQHLIVTPELLDELNTLLAGLDQWGEVEARLAAAIKAAGLPLTEGVLRLVQGETAQTGQAVVDLLGLLRGALNRSDLSPDLRQALRGSLAMLEKAVLNWAAGPDQVGAQMRSAAEVLGRSFENILAAQADGGAALDETGLLTLARLYQQCRGQGETALADKLHTFLETFQQSQLRNIRQNPVPGPGDWCTLNFVLRSGPANQPDLFPARLQIARRESEDGESIDPHSTCLTIQVDIGEQETVQVDLTLVGRLIRAQVMTPNPAVNDRSQAELPGLVEGLKQLGYQMVGATVTVGRPADHPLVALKLPPGAHSRRINLKV